MSNKSEQLESEKIDKQNQDFMDNLKGNDELKKVLFKAKNITINLTNKVVPAMSKAINKLMTEINSNKTNLKDWNTMKFLRTHCYYLSSYNRKKELNQNFEVSITMAVRLAIMMYDKPQQFEITKDNEILVMDKIATPYIEQTKQGQKGSKKKKKNENEELVEIVPSHVNKIWSVKYPTTKRPNAKTTADTSKILKDCLNTLEDLQNVAESKKPEKLLEKITDDHAGVIGSFTLIDFDLIRTTFDKVNNSQQLSGDFKQTA